MKKFNAFFESIGSSEKFGVDVDCIDHGVSWEILLQSVFVCLDELIFGA